MNTHNRALGQSAAPSNTPASAPSRDNPNSSRTAPAGNARAWADAESDLRETISRHPGAEADATDRFEESRRLGGTPEQATRAAHAAILAHLSDGSRSLGTSPAAPVVHHDHGRGSLSGLVSLAYTRDASAYPAEARDVAEANERMGERGITGQRGGIIVPDSYWQGQRAAATTTSYNDLVPTEQLGGLLVGSLRARAAVLEAGAFVLPLETPGSIPAAGGLSTHWVGENADVAESSLTTDGIPLSPKSVGVYTTASRMVMQVSSPGVEEVLRLDAIAAIAAAVDAAAIAGTGADGQPKGVLNHTGIGASTYVNGGAPDWSDIVSLQGAPEADHVPLGMSAFIMPSAMKSVLMSTPNGGSGSDSAMILDGPSFDKMAGHKALVGGNTSAGTILFGRDWRDCVIGMWGQVELVVERTAKSGQYSLGWHLFTDVAVRRVESFAKLSEASE